jgi:hypothetical protein
MPLLVNSVPNLAQGVSQQPDTLRYPGQCDEQINAWSTVVEGLKKRPNTEYVKNIDSTSTESNLFTHFVKRDETNQYMFTVSLGGVGATVVSISSSGSTVSRNATVSVSSIASQYLSLGSSSLGAVTNPLKDLRALTVADYTFLVNKNRLVNVNTDDSLKTKDLENEALVFVKLGDYEKTYDIYLDGQVVPHATSFGGKSIQSGSSTPPSGHTYESGAATSGGSQSGEHADTELIAEDLEIILKAGVASLLGVTSLTLSGGSGFADSENTKNDKANTSIFYTYKLIQKDSGGTIIGNGCQGKLTFSGGSVTAQTKTQGGSGYDTDTTTNPLTLQIIKHTQTMKVRSVYKKYNRSVRLRAALAKSQIRTIYEYYPRTTEKTIYEGTPGATVGSVTLPSISPSDITISSTTYEIERQGAVIKITGDTDFRIRTEDGLANQGLGVAYKEVASITDLPRRCFNDFRIRIRGDADIAQDDYYVRFQTKDREDFGEGSWIECAGWQNTSTSASLSVGIDTTLDFATMPITIVPVFGQVSLGQDTNLIYSFRAEVPNEKEAIEVEDRPFGYTSRQAGDDFTNPFPSFVGQTINDVFFFKNRLGFVTDNAVIFSEADQYFNFFRTTTQQLLDSAPIDVGLSHTKTAILQHAIPFQEKLMLFSKQSQFVLRGADVLSPKTVAISPVTEYDISDSVEPIALGNYIYFTFKRNDFEGMYEYFVDNNTEVFAAEEITQQVPKYIPNNVRKIAGSQAENTLIVGVDSDLKTLYVYKYFWSNREKVQSAWMKFSFDRDVVGFDFIDSKLYMVTKDTEGLHLEYLTLEDGLTDEGLDYSLLLDSRVDGSDVTVSVYNPTTKKTRISNIPYNVSLGTDIELYTKIGTQRAITMVDDTTVDVTGTIASYVDDGSGDYVTYEGDTYYCIKAHTSSSTFESINWRKSTTTPSGTLAWASSTSYSAGILYKCIVTHTSAEGDDLSTSSNWATTTDVTAATIWSSGRLYNDDTYFFIGKPYNMLYRFSDQSLKQPTERGGRSASDYTFQTIRNGSINYADTGHFTVEVTPEYRDTYSYVFNPDIVGADLSLNEFKPQSGHFRFAVQARPNEVKIEVKSASALPCKLLAAEFESLFVPRSRRYGS